jgi:nucleoid-associated protein YgaU
MCVFVAIWIAVYWLYEPGEPPVTFDRSGAAPAAANSPPAVLPNAGPLAELAPQGPRRPEAVSPPAPSKPDPEPPLPARPPPSSARVVPPEFWEYVVQKGDTGFEAVAQHAYGDRSLWQAIAKANPLVTPDKLYPGRTKLRIPVDPGNIQGVVVVPPEGPREPEVASSTPASTPDARPVEYLTKEGDTLSGISKAFYGKAGLWKKIQEANASLIPDPDSLRPGITIVIPPR